MLQNISKTLGFQKIMVYKTPPGGGGGEVNHIWLVAYLKRQTADDILIFYFYCLKKIRLGFFM